MILEYHGQLFYLYPYCGNNKKQNVDSRAYPAGHPRHIKQKFFYCRFFHTYAIKNPLSSIQVQVLEPENLYRGQGTPKLVFYVFILKLLVFVCQGVLTKSRKLTCDSDIIPSFVVDV